MEKAQHTPGPWIACDVGDYDDYDGKCRVVLGDDMRIAVVQGIRDEDAANARLIAAAPEQHDLILEMHGWLRVHAGRSDIPQEVRTRMANFADDCRRMIRHATGAASLPEAA